jgi:Tfp pilus assembly protein PilX
MFLSNRKNQKGQAVLIVLLSLSVVLIVILYILSRTITDVSLSSKEEDSLRAFSAAEAGIERALVAGSTGNQTINDATFNASVTAFSRGSFTSVFPIALKSGENATFWFTEHDPATGNLVCNAANPCFTGSQAKFCWGDVGTTKNAESPALEVTVYYKVGSEYRISRKMIDPRAGRTQNNSAPTTNCTVGSDSFEYGYTYSLAGLSNLQFATAKILYNTNVAHKIAIDVTGSGSTLPSQGDKVNSNGSFADSNRAIEVYQLHPEIPPIFANAIYVSSGDVAKN